MSGSPSVIAEAPSDLPEAFRARRGEVAAAGAGRVAAVRPEMKNETAREGTK